LFDIAQMTVNCSDEAKDRVGPRETKRTPQAYTIGFKYQRSIMEGMALKSDIGKGRHVLEYDPNTEPEGIDSAH